MATAAPPPIHTSPQALCCLQPLCMKSLLFCCGDPSTKQVLDQPEATVSAPVSAQAAATKPTMATPTKKVARIEFLQSKHSNAAAPRGGTLPKKFQITPAHPALISLCRVSAVCCVRRCTSSTTVSGWVVSVHLTAASRAVCERNGVTQRRTAACVST